MAIKCKRCDTPVVFWQSAPDYFATCLTHDEDLYSFETTNDDERSIRILTEAIDFFMSKNINTIPLGILNDILDQLTTSNEVGFWVLDTTDDDEDDSPTQTSEAWDAVKDVIRADMEQLLGTENKSNSVPNSEATNHKEQA